MQGFMNAMEKAKNAGFTIDPNATAKSMVIKILRVLLKNILSLMT